MTGRVLLLSPSRGLGGGIERYVATLEWAFAAEGVEGQRLDLSGPGARAHARLLARGKAIRRAGSEPARLVVAHLSLLPVAALLAREPPHADCRSCVTEARRGVTLAAPERAGAPPDATR